MSKSIEQQYQNLDEITHILHRPEMYIGANTPRPTVSPVMEGQFLEEKEIEYTPALMKIIDEIISNSTDEHVRTIKKRDELPTRQRKNAKILDRIEIKVEGNTVTVYDNGGIPVAYHSGAKTYLPTMLFGNLRAGSNFDDDSGDRTTTGKNGVGSALTNVLSSRFSVTTCDGEAEFFQEWTENSRNIGNPVIRLKKGKRYAQGTYPSKDVYSKFGTASQKTLKVQYDKINELNPGTTISFDIDFSQFPEEGEISIGMLKLLEYRCIVAAAANPGLTVSFNDTEYCFQSFMDYVKLFGEDQAIIHEKNELWEFCIVPTLINQGGKSFSFVNGNACNRGTHVNHLNNFIGGHLEAWVKKKKKFDCKKNSIMKQYNTFINLKVVNPVYGSQTKEILETSHGKYHGGEENKWPQVGNKTLNKIENSEVIENLILLNERNDSEAEKKQLAKKNKEMKRRNVKTIRKLTDANEKKNRKDCELWIYEGASAANSFISVRDPKIHASYELKGKVMNALHAKQTTIANNTEFSEIMQAGGMRFNGEYELKNLRYGKFIIATDADVDGISINAGLTTFFCRHFPDIVEAGMLYYVQSPLYKITKNRGGKVTYCYTEEEFQKADTKNCSIEYFKGLGSLEMSEYEEMVNNPRLVQLNKDDATMDTLEVWMGGDSVKRKRFLETA